MTLLDASSSNRLPSGAGRTADWVYPDALQTFATSTAPTVGRNRLNGSTIALTIGGFGGGGVNVVADSYATGNGATLGTPGYAMAGNGIGAGQIVRWSAGPGAWGNIIKAKTAYPAGLDPYGCTMVKCRYAVLTRTPGTTNCGLECTMNGGPIGTNVGVAWQADSTTLNQVQFCTCQTAPTVVRTRVTPTGFDETKLNLYGVFFSAATKDAEAFVQPYLNGNPAGAAIPWGAGTVLPTAGTVMTMALPQLYVAQNATIFFPVNAFQISSGPTLLDVL